MQNEKEKNIEYTGVFPFMSDEQIYDIAKESYVKFKDGSWDEYLNALIEDRNEGLREARGEPTERTKEDEILARMSESTRRALKEPRDTRYGISSHSFALAEQMRTKNSGYRKLPKGYVFKNPYLLPDEVMAELMKKVAENKTQIDRSDDFNMHAVKAEEPEDKDRQLTLEDKIKQLKISPVSKQKLTTFIANLGLDEKPYTVEQFSILGGNYLTSFLNPAIEAGIIIKNGSRKATTYKVNYEDL